MLQLWQRVSSNDRCSGCYLAWYCGKPCQLEHWPAHKHACKEMKLTNSRDAEVLCASKSSDTVELLPIGSEIDVEESMPSECDCEYTKIQESAAKWLLSKPDFPETLQTAIKNSNVCRSGYVFTVTCDDDDKHCVIKRLDTDTLRSAESNDPVLKYIQHSIRSHSDQFTVGLLCVYNGKHCFLRLPFTESVSTHVTSRGGWLVGWWHGRMVRRHSCRVVGGSTP